MGDNRQPAIDGIAPSCGRWVWEGWARAAEALCHPWLGVACRGASSGVGSARGAVATQLQPPMAALGCPAEVAEAILGHLLPGVQGTYNRHHYDGERRDWLTRLDARLSALAAGR